MEPEENKRLHFIVRHDRYRHAAGYGYFLNHALTRLNQENPSWARELLERTALFLLNPADENRLSENVKEQPKNSAMLLECLPPEMRKRLKINTDFFDARTPQGKSNLNMYFGSAANSEFGELYPHAVEHSAKRRPGDAGCCLTTTILASPEDAIQGRGYFETLKQNYELKENAIPADFNLEFEYPIPGTNRTLPLMKIASPQNLEAAARDRYSNKRVGFDLSPVFYKPEIQLLFLHPNCNRAYFNQLIDCIDPLLQKVDAPASHVAPGMPLPPEKKEAVATIYWLLAQSTPVIRGGSAYANVILEHLAHRLRGQGYEYDIPFTKEGVDLWAQAATLPLEDKANMKGFKTRFCEGLFFDPHTKSADVEQYLCDALQNAATKEAAAKQRALADANRNAIIAYR